MRNHMRLAVFTAGILIASMLLSACGGHYATLTPTTDMGPLQGIQTSAGENPSAILVAIPPMISILLAWGLAWFYARRARLTAAGRLPLDFELLEKEAAALQEKVKCGELPEQDYKKQMLEKMIRDGSGNWWTVGKETGDWYRHDGQNWVKDSLPFSPSPISKMARRPWVAGLIMSMLHAGIAVDAIATIVVAIILAFDSSMEADALPVVILIILFLLCVLFSFLLARWLWASHNGDWIVIGLATSMALSVLLLMLASKLPVNVALPVIGTPSLALGVILTMVLTRRAWIR